MLLLILLQPNFSKWRVTSKSKNIKSLFVDSRLINTDSIAENNCKFITSKSLEVSPTSSESCHKKELIRSDDILKVI